MPRPADIQQARLVRQSLYALKRQYGYPVDVYRQLDAETNLQTGVKTIVKTVFPVRRAVVLPGTISREAIQTISVISANKKMLQGGTFDRGLRNFILDSRDLPAGFEFNNDDWLVYRNRRYELVSIEEFEAFAGWVLRGKEVFGPRPEQTFLVKADHLLSLDDTGAA
jgi:hypothetical protein